MDFKINNKTYVIYVPEDKKGYLYLVNKSTGKVDFGLSYSEAEALFGNNLKDIKDERIGLEKNINALERIRIKNDKNDKGRRAERVVAIWSNFKKRIMTPGALTDLERKNNIQENPNAGPAMNKLYDTIVSIQGKEPAITAYSKKWFGETGDQKDSNANYKLTEDILESMRLFTSFYTIGKRQYGAKDNPFKNANDYENDENLKNLKELTDKIKNTSGAKFKPGLDMIDGLHFYAPLKDGGGLARVVYINGGNNTIAPDPEKDNRNIEKGLPQREDGSQKFPFSLEKYKEIIQRAPTLKDKIFFVKVGNDTKPYKNEKPYTPPPAATAADPGEGTLEKPYANANIFFKAIKGLTPQDLSNKTYYYKDGTTKIEVTYDPTGTKPTGKPLQESLKQRRERLLHEAIFKKLVR